MKRSMKLKKLKNLREKQLMLLRVTNKLLRESDSPMDNDDMSGIPLHKQASIAGIRDNGLEWSKRRLQLRKYLQELSELSSSDELVEEEISDELIRKICNNANLAGQYLRFALNRIKPGIFDVESNNYDSTIEDAVDRLCDMSCESIFSDDPVETKVDIVSELRYIYNDIYDFCDYYRILIN